MPPEDVEIPVDGEYGVKVDCEAVSVACEEALCGNGGEEVSVAFSIK